MFDDVDISTMNPQKLRSLISVLFTISTRENIQLSTSFNHMKDHCDFNDVIKASKLGSAHDFIMEIPNGYDTVVQQKI